MPIPRSQLRLTSAELDDLLLRERVCRAATVSPDGEPHVAPLWFVWLDGTLYFNNLNRSRRTRDIQAGSRVAISVDAGEAYGDLHGAVLYGRFEDASGDAKEDEARKLFGEKYFGGMALPKQRSHSFLKLVPDKVVSWDFKKIPAGRDRRASS